MASSLEGISGIKFGKNFLNQGDLWHLGYSPALELGHSPALELGYSPTLELERKRTLPHGCWKYAVEAIIKWLLLYFLVHDNCLLFML